MSEEATLDTGSQEVAEPVAAEPVAAEPVVEQQQPTSEATGTWLDMVDEQYRSNPLINKWDDVNGLVKTHLNAQKIIGADKVVKPGPNATDDEIRAVYQELGAPTDPVNYELERTEIFDDASFDTFRNKAYEIGLSNKQAQAVASLYEEQVNNGLQALEQRAEEARFQGEQELRQEFGQHFETRLKMARSAAETVMPNPQIFNEVRLEDGRLMGDHPEIVRAFAKVAEMLGEDSLVGEPTEFVMSAQEARQRIAEHMRPNTPYTIAGHPEHDAAVAEVLRLRGYATGG